MRRSEFSRNSFRPKTEFNTGRTSEVKVNFRLSCTLNAKMKRRHVLNCNFSVWYPKFKNITIRSRIIPLPKEFVDYLKADNVVLPGEPVVTRNSSEDVESDSEEWLALNEDPSEQTISAPEFNEVDSGIKEAVIDLEGVVFPKLNWSSPLDASWISFDGTLKCQSPNDIYLLLKSSDNISTTLFDTFKHCEDGEGEMTDGFELVLRKWKDINPGMEFRCFVKDNKLIAISQRDTASCYDFIEHNEKDICSDIASFFKQKIAYKFPDSSFTFDIYRYSPQKILLIDFNPFGAQTDPLLFTWNELVDPALSICDNDNEFQGVFKYVTSDGGVQPNPSHFSRMPTDIADLACGNDVNKLVDLLNVRNLIQQPGEESDDD